MRSPERVIGLYVDSIIVRYRQIELYTAGTLEMSFLLAGSNVSPACQDAYRFERMRVTDDLERIFSLGDVGSEQETRRYQVSLLYRLSC